MTCDLLTDVNLSEMVFSGQNSEISLEFLNMSDGGRVGTLSCGGVVTFAFHDYTDAGLPAYVGKVTLQEVSAQDALELLRRFGYHIEHNREYLRQMRLQYVSLEGGLMVHIVCQRASFDRAVQQPVERGEPLAR